MQRAEQWGVRVAPLGTMVCAALLSGCSFLFVDTVPDDADRLPPDRPIDCTSRRLAPIVDTIVAGYQVVRTVLAFTAEESAYEDAPITRGADIGFGIGFTALFTSSAIYGFYQTGQCRDAENRRLIRAHEPTSSRESPEGSPVALLPVPETPSWGASPVPSWSRPLPQGTSLIWRAAMVGDVVAMAGDAEGEAAADGVMRGDGAMRGDGVAGHGAVTADDTAADDTAAEIVLSRQSECSTLLRVGEMCLGR